MPKKTKGASFAASLGAAITLTILIIGFIGGGWALRPIIDYNISSAQDDYQTYSPMRVGLVYQNRGSVDISLHLVVDVTNANITLEKEEPWITCNGTRAIFNVAAQMHMDNSASYYVNIMPIDNAQSFSVKYSVEDSTGWSIPNGVISHLFLEPHPYYPTYLLYNKTGASTYQLIK